MHMGIGSVFMHVFFGVSILSFIVGVGLNSSISFAQTPESGAPKFFANNDNNYRGGRGLITASGPTGMFLNPTSGTLSKGNISAQVFGSTIKPISDLPTGGQDQFAYYNGLLGYGVTDWLEVGGLMQVVDRSNNTDQQIVAAGGGYARVRVLKDQGFLPEISVGGMFFEGNEMLDRRTLFTALSKRVDISDTGFVRGFRLHLGGRYYWQKDASELGFKSWRALAQRGDSAAVGYLGAEMELPKHLFLVGEIQSRETGDQQQPFSFGVQFRHPEGFGLSVAVLRPGLQEAMTAYIGIGINFY
jgi:hypothetical protein